MTTPEFLRSIGACEPAIVQVGTRKLKDAVQQSVRADWLFWLAAVNAGKDEWPGRDRVLTTLAKCVMEYYPDEASFETAHPMLKDFDDQLAKRVAPNEFVVMVMSVVKELSMVGKQLFNAARLERMANILRENLSFPFLERLD